MSEQDAFRHMIIEGRLLRAHGEALRQLVVRHKMAGAGTELAFALAMGLNTTDPYRALLELEGVPDAALRELTMRMDKDEDSNANA